ncbi:ESX-1 secretion-associated protein EspH [Mycolicibacterium vanbaalenii]|uniref:ESX-1 secretion-associated protein EspH n=1 Tax=Mycolicibacterium vanbaalenii TaxID=110539 RepID=A0A5S9QZ52_MYCVN|nr:DUF2694 family protein [Mycolicibacterium vanbaalenii]CAA0124376.1 ESX-1 secretion-associated protein EspH [Mycolicibacterium vanbaalenii]
MAVPPPGDSPPEEVNHDDLAALDFGVVGDGAGETDLGAILGGYGSGGAAEAAEHDDDATPTFTVTNPPGTVTVTTYLDGRVHQIELSPKAAAMAEAALAEEIVLVADLATRDARSAQYTFMLDGMREQGHDNVATRDFLNRDLDLPTPEQARAARAELFTTRYAGEE